MPEPRLFMLHKFQEHLRQSFQVFCDRHGLEKSDVHFVSFLLDQDLIPTTQMRRYTVRKEFEKICLEKDLAKTIMVDTLANRFGISERTVWAILKNMKTTDKPW